MLDVVDARIVAILQNNARVSNAEIARQLVMAPSAILERIRKLEARGVIRAYETRLAPKEVGLGLLAFVLVRADEAPGAVRAGEQLAAIPEVQEVHHVAGEDCYLVKVRSRDPEDLGRILRDEIGAIAAVRSTRSTIVLETVKESAALPLAAVSDEEASGHAA